MVISGKFLWGVMSDATKVGGGNPRYIKTTYILEFPREKKLGCKMF